MNSGSYMTSWPIKVHFRLGLLFGMNRVAHYSGTVAIRRTEKDGGFLSNRTRPITHKVIFFGRGGGGGGGEISVPVFKLRILG